MLRLTPGEIEEARRWPVGSMVCVPPDSDWREYFGGDPLMITGILIMFTRQAGDRVNYQVSCEGITRDGFRAGDFVAADGAEDGSAGAKKRLNGA